MCRPLTAREAMPPLAQRDGNVAPTAPAARPPPPLKRSLSAAPGAAKPPALLRVRWPGHGPTPCPHLTIMHVCLKHSVDML